LDTLTLERLAICQSRHCDAGTLLSLFESNRHLQGLTGGAIGRLLIQCHCHQGMFELMMFAWPEAVLGDHASRTRRVGVLLCVASTCHQRSDTMDKYREVSVAAIFHIGRRNRK
jgi:hypothetical protein